MAARAIWTGYLKVSLVTVPVRLFNAVSEVEKIRLNQLHKDCGVRVRQDLVCPEHGSLDRTSDIVKGYQHDRGRYVVIDDDLAKLKLETTKTIEVLQFSPASEIDPVYLDAPYWLSPDGPVAEEGFAVVREAMRKTGMVGVGRVVIGGREKAVAIRPVEGGLGLSTLHSPRELREPDFEGIPDHVEDGEELALGEMLIRRLAKLFDISEWKDRYQEALAELVKAKLAGVAPPAIEERPPLPVINLMDAIKRSLEQLPEGKEERREAKRAKAASEARAGGRLH
jgi:DNA end-binding protein Ku